MAGARLSPIRVAAPVMGSGRDLARLWRVLWSEHESWGGYPGASDTATYDALARRLDAAAARRAGDPLDGQHVHLAAYRGDRVVGQVEGWLERFGSSPSTPACCEVRSLVVAPDARGMGVGELLMRELERLAAGVWQRPTFLVAEVLEENPARSFYRRLGYAPISWTLMLEPEQLLPASPSLVFARPARAADALSLAVLDGALAVRRRRLGDLRFDGPRSIDAQLVAALAEYVGSSQPPAELVVEDCELGAVVASASLTVGPLDAPFVPVRRAMLGRFAVAAGHDAELAAAALARLGLHLARSRGARRLELTDLPSPEDPLHRALRELGATVFSRIVGRLVS